MRTAFQPAAGLVTCLGLLLASTGAAAQGSPPEGPGLRTPLDDTVWLQLGAFRPSIDSKIRKDGDAGAIAGTPLHLEDDLGLSAHKTLPTGLLGVRLAQRWRAEFEYFQLKRSVTDQTLDSDVVFGDTTFSSAFDARLDSKSYRLSAGYSLLRTPQAEAGVVLGVHVTKFLMELSGEGTTSGGDTVALVDEREKKTVPLPTAGFYGSYLLTERWQLGGRFDYFELDHDGYDGRIVNAEANLQYRLTPNAGLGFGWRLNDLRVTGNTDSFTGKLHYRFNGPQAFVQVAF